MSDPVRFTFPYLEGELRAAIEAGYKIIRCREYPEIRDSQGAPRLLVNRVDVDFSVKKAERLGQIFDRLDIKGTFFIRLHAPEYNPFSFENYRIFRRLLDHGHEIGYHSEVVDEAAIWGEEPEDCLRRDIDCLERMFGIKVEGVASHGGTTGLNNLDFWKGRRPEEFGLRYEAYDREPGFGLFHHSLYVSDSSWTYWKCYRDGKLVDGDRRSISEHAIEGHPLLYTLIHPDTYFDRHFYE